jgi:hypothetical protein
MMKAMISSLILVMIIFSMNEKCCYGQEEENPFSDVITPMEKTELNALYSAIQGFVGNSWNGSDLYPDPCGWSPIQVHLFFSPTCTIIL